jgi:outer membrane biosynthesis protein TonB
MESAMKHFHIELERNGTTTRSWDIWAEHLRVGSSIQSDIVLPPPYAAVVAECETALQPFEVNLGTERLRIVEDTDLRKMTWASARERMELARRLGWKEPGEAQSRSRRIVLGIMGVMGAVAMVGMVVVGKTSRPDVPKGIESVIEFVQPTPQEKKEEEPPKDVQPQEQAAVSPEKPSPDEVGGSTENRTVSAPRQVPSDVMALSILDKINNAMDGAIGEAVDASAENVVDVVLAGGGGHLTKGKGGFGASGNGDRREAMAGVGFGHGGPAGYGPGVASNRQGKDPTFGKGGKNGKAIATRTLITLPKPSEVEIGGEAGSRSPESILSVIRAHVSGFRYTYEKYLKENPAIGGKIALKFTISPAGDIIAIALVSSNTGSTALDEDIKDKARRMKFDAIEKGNVTVSYAFVLDKQ